ncbi:MAG: DUF4115 domain-containing protein, partial [Vulcanimicrobiaceae bacterium]
RPALGPGATAASTAAAVVRNTPSDLPSRSLAAAVPIARSRRPVATLSRTIELRLTAPSWLRVDVDGAEAFEGILPAGSRKDFHGRSASVRTGNAGAVVVIVDGRNQGTMGQMGDVVERTFNLARE